MDNNKVCQNCRLLVNVLSYIPPLHTYKQTSHTICDSQMGGKVETAGVCVCVYVFIFLMGDDNMKDKNLVVKASCSASGNQIL